MARRDPDPEHTPDGPAYEGRLLARPEEEVVDQGAGFDVRTLMTRRTVLALVGVGVGATALAACGTATASGTSSTTATATAGSAATAATLPASEIPDETAGPYPGDGSNGPDVLEESGIVRRDIRSSIGADDTVDGVPLDFTITVTDMAAADAAFANAAVYAWHCDAQGRYSMYSDGITDKTYLRGVQVADTNGQVSFTSVVPGCYSGRWTHIHFEVYPDVDSITDSANAIATSQMALPEDMLDAVYTQSAYDGSADNLAQISLAGDNVFGDDSAALQLATVAGNATDGYTASLVARVDTTTAAAPSGGGQAPPAANG